VPQALEQIVLCSLQNVLSLCVVNFGCSVGISECTKAVAKRAGQISAWVSSSGHKGSSPDRYDPSSNAISSLVSNVTGKDVRLYQDQH
jgi:hypothetical protein